MRPIPLHSASSPVCKARRVLLCGVGLALFLTLFVDVAVLTVPIYDMQLFDRVLLSRNMSTVAMLSLICGAGLVIYGLLDYLRSAALVAMSERVGQILGTPVLKAGVRASLGGNQTAGGEALRDLNDVRNFLASGAISVPLDALCSPLLFCVLFLLHPAFGWLATAGVSALVILGIVMDVLIRPAVTAAGQQRAHAGNQFAAGLRDSDQTEGLGMLPVIARRWARRQEAALHTMQEATHRSDNVGSVAKIVRLSLQAGVMALGAVLILSTQASPGALMGANLLLGKVLGPFDALVSTWRRWIAAGAAWSRLNETLSGAGPDGHARSSNAPLGEPGSGGGLSLQDVRVLDPASKRLLLDGITIEIAPGTALALMGQNGAGKSTLLRLMVGLVEPTSGSVQVGGTPLALIDGRCIGYLPQGVHLLDGTVWDNIARFREAPADDVIAAASTAGVHGIVGRLRQGYSTKIGPTVASLSGGQKQRIGLARALFQGPQLIGLDEPDASLDSRGEDALLEAIAAARDRGAIVVVATHRPKLLAAMDMIGTVKAGQLDSLVAVKRPEAVRPLLQPASA